MLLYSFALIALTLAAKNLIYADPTNLITAYDTQAVVYKIWWWVALFLALTYWLTHWIFAFKYWNLAVKFEKIKNGKDPNASNRWSLVIMAIGFVFNFAGAVLTQLHIAARITGPQKSKLMIAAIVFTTPLYVSWLFLADAFRRFTNSKQPQQVIKNLHVFALIFTYFLYAIGTTVIVLVSLAE